MTTYDQALTYVRVTNRRIDETEAHNFATYNVGIQNQYGRRFPIKLSLVWKNWVDSGFPATFE